MMSGVCKDAMLRVPGGIAHQCAAVAAATQGVAAGNVNVPQALHLVVGLLLAQLNRVAHALRASILGAGARLDGTLSLSRGHG